MKQQEFIVSYDKQKCRINGQTGTIKTVRIEEVFPDGTKKTVHTDVRYISSGKPNPLRNLISIIRTPKKDRRAA